MSDDISKLEQDLLSEIQQYYDSQGMPSINAHALPLSNNDNINPDIANFINNMNAQNASLNDDNYQRIMEKYKKIQELRGDLDTKMKNLHNLPDSISKIYKSSLDNTVYINMLCTVALVSLVFIVFQKTTLL